MKKSVLALALSISMMCTLFLCHALAVQNPFSDVSNSDYYYDAVLWAYENDVTKGTTETTFSPNATCTRGQVVTFLWRSVGQPEPETSVNPFTDVSTSNYYYKAVLWAVENGITNGTSATTFSPNNLCTYAHVITFLWRSAGADSVDTRGFGDAWYSNALAWGVLKGIVQSVDSFQSSTPCPRADIVTYLYRNATIESGPSNFVGEWEEVESDYYVMKIVPLSSESCQITITSKFAKWDAVGEYDARRDRIYYSDGTYSSLNRNSMAWEVEESGCSGWILYEAPDALCWLDDDEVEWYFIKTGSLMGETTLNDISYREAIADGWGGTWAEVYENMGSDPSWYIDEAEADPSLYGGNGNPWDGITIDEITYEMALKHGWGDAWMAFVEHVGTGG